MGTTFSCTMQNAFSAPIATPTHSPTRMQTQTGSPALSSRPQTNAEQPILEPTEKSVLPAISEIVRKAPMIMSFAI